MTEYFEKWVKRMNNSFYSKGDFRYTTDGERTVIVSNVKTGKQGIAKCHSSDTFSLIIGRAIAYARCCGKLVPDMDYEPCNSSDCYHIFVYNKIKYKVIANETCSYKKLKKDYSILETQNYINKRLKESDHNSFVYLNSSNFLAVISKT